MRWGEILAEVSALFAAVTEQAGTAVTSLADQQAIQAAVIERLALDAGLIDQPNNTHH